MKKLFLIFTLLLSIVVTTNAQLWYTSTDVSDTVTTPTLKTSAESILIKADITPIVSSAGTYDTIIIQRYITGSDNPYWTTGDTIVVNDATGTAIKTYTGNIFTRFKAKIYLDTTNAATFNLYAIPK